MVKTTTSAPISLARAAARSTASMSKVLTSSGTPSRTMVLLS